jgi:hypothetical protein
MVLPTFCGAGLLDGGVARTYSFFGVLLKFIYELLDFRL